MVELLGIITVIPMQISYQEDRVLLYEKTANPFRVHDDLRIKLAAVKEVDVRDAIWILESEPVQVSYTTKGYTFYKGGTGILGTPIEHQLRLVAVKGKEKTMIASVADLKDRVNIMTPEQALDFVRLFTAPETHFLLSDSAYIEPRLTNDRISGVGEYTAEYNKQMQLKAEVLKTDVDGFVIERNLLDKTGKLFRVIERVSKNGVYALEKKVLIDDKPPIAYPLYQ